MQQLRIDPASIVAHQYSQLAGRIFQFYFYALCLRVTECVNQSLAANAVDLIAQDRVQRARLAILQ